MTVLTQTRAEEILANQHFHPILKEAIATEMAEREARRVACKTLKDFHLSCTRYLEYADGKGGFYVEETKEGFYALTLAGATLVYIDRRGVWRSELIDGMAAAESPLRLVEEHLMIMVKNQVLVYGEYD
jgi:hypothetical protein